LERRASSAGLDAADAARAAAAAPPRAVVVAECHGWSVAQQTSRGRAAKLCVMSREASVSSAEMPKLPVVSMHAPPAVPDKLIALATRLADKILFVALRQLFFSSGQLAPTAAEEFERV